MSEDKTPITFLTGKIEPEPTERTIKIHPEKTGHQIPNENNLFSEDENNPLFANLQERFSAFLVDTILFFYLLNAWGFLFKYINKLPLEAPFQHNLEHRNVFFVSSALLYFVYYFFFEAIFGASPGKWAARLHIRQKKGGVASLFSILVRNIFRLIDYPLFFFTGIGMIEATKTRQRLGDWLAGTVIVRKEPYHKKITSPERVSFPSSTRRTLAFLADSVLFLVFTYTLLLLVPMTPEIFRWASLMLFPLAALLYLCLPEWLFQSTFGKCLFGLQVIQEDGYPATFAAILLRNIARITDMNPAGYLCSVLSSHKQRPGDIIAGTLVILSPKRPLKHWLAIPLMIVLPAVTVFATYHYQKKIIPEGYEIQIGDWHLDPVIGPVKRALIKGLQIEALHFAFDEKQINHGKTFAGGDAVYIQFLVSGHTIQEEKSWLQTDLKVEDAEGFVILDEKNIVNASLHVGDKKSILLIARFALHPRTPTGTYTLTLTLRDLMGSQETRVLRRFQVRP